MKKTGTKRKLYFKFIAIVGGVVGGFIILAVLALAAYFKFAPRDIIDSSKGGTVMADDGTVQQEGDLISNVFGVPLRTNFIIMGVNPNDYLSDTIIVGCFNADTKMVNLISIPRDTYVVMSADKIKTLQTEGRSVPSSGVMKINAVHSYPGRDQGTQYLTEQVEELLGIKIHYYAEIDTTAFRKIVDAIGGVEMEIPAGGLYYNDPTQNLVINVPGGHQKLTGEMAEGVVRFRATYPRADLQRIEVQQQFMKELFSQVLNRDTVIKNFPSIMTTLLSYVKTDFGVADLPKYLKYITELKSDNLSMQTLPGEAKTLYQGDKGVSYYLHDSEETRILIDEVFYGKGEEAEEAEEAKEEDRDESGLDVEQIKGLRIQILNGSDTTGLAGGFKDAMTKAGYNVVNTGNYTGTRKKETRIMTKEKLSAEAAERIGSLFKNWATEWDKEIPTGYDMIIIIGTDEG